MQATYIDPGFRRGFEIRAAVIDCIEIVFTKLFNIIIIEIYDDIFRRLSPVKCRVPGACPGFFEVFLCLKKEGRGSFFEIFLTIAEFVLPKVTAQMAFQQIELSRI